MREGVLLGEGAHCFEDRDHAEIVALKAAFAAGHDVTGATAYVTLEPCSHHGRTGPCADALVAAGIARCVVATVDPNPVVRGRGLKKLREADVVVDLLEAQVPAAQQARRLNDAFAFSVQHERPFVTFKVALSRDGKLGPPDAERAAAQPVWITGPAARTDVQRLRHASDALLTGIGTVLADNPLLSDRTGLPRRRPLLRVILDSKLRILDQSALVQHAADDLLVFCAEGVADERLASLRRFRLEVQPIRDLRSLAGLEHILHVLQARGVRSVLTEAGAALNGALLRAGLVDEVVVYQGSQELGAEAIPFTDDGVDVAALEAQLTSVQRVAFPHGSGEDLRVSGYLHDPWAGV